MNIIEKKISEDSLKALDFYSASCSPCQFSQSSKWLKFQTLAKYEPIILNYKNIYFLALKHKLPLNKKYYYIPRGPFLNDDKLWPEFIKELKNYFKKDKSIIFVRFEPDNSFDNQCRKVIDVQPSKTFQTDLSLSEDELLNNMHPKTRYNIRLGLKKDLEFLSNDQDIEGFWKLMNETTKRDKFSSHHKDYYEKMIKSGATQLATIRYNNKLLAAGIFCSFGNIITYLHGVSSSEHRDLMSPYVLHWKMMMYAKSQGIKWYDWHGIDSQRWPGVTRFKLGFGGKEIDYPGTFDLILAPNMYLGYNILRALRRLF
jgi:lipid II:glycine glycyltransferase (peptidoglycan interpeptide bridge formation enzyme)